MSGRWTGRIPRAGQGVVWYTGQFYALFFLVGPLKLDYLSAYWLVGLSLVIGTPFFVFFGWLSDRIGRLRLMMASCLIAAVTYIPLFAGLTHYVNPDLEAFQQRSTPTITVDKSTCGFHLFVTPLTTFSECDRARDFMTKQGLSFNTQDVPGKPPTLSVANTTVEGWDAAKWSAALTAAGAPTRADPAKVNWVMAELILVILVNYVTMNYAPIAAFLVELFPTRIRYTSLSLPYQIGGGWFGGMLPLTATAMIVASGDIYYGLWYPIVVAVMTLVIGSIFLRETKDVDIEEGSAQVVKSA